MNIDLLMYLLHNQKLSDKPLKKFLEKLSDESDESINFTFEFIAHIDHLLAVKFIPLLWKGFWWYVIVKSEFSQKKIAEYFDLLLKNSEVEKLVELNLYNSVKTYIESLDYLSGYDVILNEKYEKLFQRLNIKFRALKVNNNFPLFNYIYENNHYQINIDMLNKIAFVKGATESEIADKLKVAHFTTLNELEAIKKMMSYIDAHINEYIENVFLKIETNTQESEKSLLSLLNHAKISFENKIAIIQKEETKISDLSTVLEDKSIWDELLKANKIEPNWNNLLYYYQEKNEMDDILINFINQKENYVELSKIKMSGDAIFEETLRQKFSREVLLCNLIYDEAYDFIASGIRYMKYPNLAIDSLSPIKIDTLLKNGKLALTQKNIEKLQELFPNKFIGLIEKFKTEFLEKIDDFTLDEGEYIDIIGSPEFMMNEKISVLERIDITLFDNKKLVEIAIDIYEHSPKKITIELFDKLFEKASYEDALRILIAQIPYLDKEKIIECLNQFESPYPDLIEKTKKPLKIEINQYNNVLVTMLKEKGLISSFSEGEEKIKVNRFHK